MVNNAAKTINYENGHECNVKNTYALHENIGRKTYNRKNVIVIKI